MDQDVKSEKSRTEKKNYTYIVRCADGTLYTGWTTDLKKRISVHNSGTGAKYTRSRLPVRLVYFEEFSTKNEAMSREAHIKHMSKAGKEDLINTFSRSGKICVNDLPEKMAELLKKP